MKQENKQLLFQNICAMLPYDVCVHIRYKTGEPCYGKLTPIDIQWFIDSKIEIIKPYLRPMSSMTNEEKTEFRRFITWTFDCDYQANTLKGILNGNEIETDHIVELFDWLNAHHFDYRGLIPMGLALEAPEGMYGESDFKDTDWKYYPKDRFSSYEEYTRYLKCESLAVDAPEGKCNN